MRPQTGVIQFVGQRLHADQMEHLLQAGVSDAGHPEGIDQYIAQSTQGQIRLLRQEERAVAPGQFHLPLTKRPDTGQSAYQCAFASA